jgi:hypothetical protein
VSECEMTVYIEREWDEYVVVSIFGHVTCPWPAREGRGARGRGARAVCSGVGTRGSGCSEVGLEYRVSESLISVGAQSILQQ